MADDDYVDFDVSISCEGDKLYAKVIDSPAGQSSRQVIPSPFVDVPPAQLLLQLEVAVLRSNGNNRAQTARGERILRDFGRGLYNALFRSRNEIESVFNSSLNIIERDPRIEGLRLKLRIESPELSQLPWEYVYDDRRNDYLCLRERSPLVRFLEVSEPARTTDVYGPLNILGMIANPGGEWGRLDTEKERRAIDDAIEPLQREGKVNFLWVAGETIDDLLDAVQGGAWHVFHFIGHGGVHEPEPGGPGENEPGEGFIVLSTEAGGAREVTAGRLKNYLQGRCLRLVVLNCCDSGRATGGDNFSSTGAALVRSGIPAVVAMQFPVSNGAATKFASGFYRSLANNECLEKAVTWGRIRMQSASIVEWGIPVLFTRCASGHLFNLRGEPQHPPPRWSDRAEPHDAVAARGPPAPDAPPPPPDEDEAARRLAREALSRLFRDPG